MSSMDLMKVDSWTLYAIRQNPLLLLCLLLLLVSTRFLSLMKQTIRHPTYNYSLGHRSKSFKRTVVLSLPVTSRTKIIEPLHSRTTVIDFNARGKIKQELAASFFERCRGILTAEDVPFSDKVVAEVVQKYYPDFRRTLNELQRYASSGSIDTGILAVLGDAKIDTLVDSMRNKKFNDVKKWVQQNLDSDPAAILRQMYDNLSTMMDGPSVAAAVLIIADYQYKSAFVADQEINLLACLTQLMMECNFN